MALRLHNTLTRTKEDFVPIDPSNVRMYVCGPTVYDFAHIGNARPLIVFDVLFRLLRHLATKGEWDGGKGTKVTYVRNITDVDDKINARAAEEYPDLPLNEAIREVTTRTEKQFHEDVAALGCLPPTHEPRATEYIRRDDAPEDMIRLIGKLIEKRNAYAAEGHVLFDVPSMRDYGRLSNRTLDEMVAGARVEVAPYKRDPMDFVLWKPSKPGEPSWPSPWGDGRPGWHIECSAMAGALLGETFDIHGGGIDLIFPHHENEIAQSRCAHGTAVMANTWLHNGFLQVEGEKMSKSLGNFVTIRELLRKWPGRALRLNMLKTHYRQPIDWTSESLKDAYDELSRWAIALAGTRAVSAGYLQSVQRKPAMPSVALVSVLSDDLNSSAAVTVLREHYQAARLGNERATDNLLNDCEFLGLLRHDQLGVFNTAVIAQGKGVLTHDLYDAGRRLKVYVANGMDREKNALIADLQKAGVSAKVSTDGYVDFEAVSGEQAHTVSKADALIAARAAARKAKNFAEADRIRAELDAMGIALKDAKDPKTGELVTTWEVKR